jgi:hypothetical protein
MHGWCMAAMATHIIYTQNDRPIKRVNDTALKRLSVLPEWPRQIAAPPTPPKLIA